MEKQNDKKEAKETSSILPIDKIKPLESDIQEFVDKYFWEIV